MQVPHRQGIVKSVPNFLQATGGTVSIVIPLPGYILVTVADGESDYLFSETSSVSHAWTGPFQSGTNYWLYWDIHPLTGAKTYGHTLYEPIESSSAPLSPVGDQHWFDTSSNTMKVWNAAVGRWVNKIRVFAARLTGLSVFVSMSINSPAYEGTQVGSYLTAPVLAGFLVYDDQGKAIRKSDGKFFTTESSGVTGMHTASRVKLSGIVKEAESTANMARNTVVVFTDFDKIGPANPYLSTQQKQFGIIEEDVVIGDFINVVTEGMVSSSDWDWTPFSVNTPLYVGAGGVLTTEATPPALTPVALITGKQTINFGTPRVVSVGGTNVGVMTDTDQGTGRLSVAAVNNQDPIVVGDNDPRLTDARAPLAHDHDGVYSPTAHTHAYEPIDATILRDADIGISVASQSHTHGDYVDVSGDTMTGFLTLSGDPTADMHAATKQYVDNNAGGGGGDPVPYVSPTPPLNPTIGMLWEDISNATYPALKQYVNSPSTAVIRIDQRALPTIMQDPANWSRVGSGYWWDYAHGEHWYTFDGVAYMVDVHPPVQPPTGEADSDNVDKIQIYDGELSLQEYINYLNSLFPPNQEIVFKFDYDKTGFVIESTAAVNNLVFTPWGGLFDDWSLDTYPYTTGLPNEYSYFYLDSDHVVTHDPIEWVVLRDMSLQTDGAVPHVGSSRQPSEGGMYYDIKTGAFFVNIDADVQPFSSDPLNPNPGSVTESNQSAVAGVPYFRQGRDSIQGIDTTKYSAGGITFHTRETQGVAESGSIELRCGIAYPINEQSAWLGGGIRLQAGDVLTYDYNSGVPLGSNPAGGSIGIYAGAVQADNAHVPFASSVRGGNVTLRAGGGYVSGEPYSNDKSRHWGNIELLWARNIALENGAGLSVGGVQNTDTLMGYHRRRVGSPSESLTSGGFLTPAIWRDLLATSFVWQAPAAGTTPLTFGFGNLTTGNVTLGTLSTSSVGTRLRRLTFGTGTVAGSSAGTRHNAATFVATSVLSDNANLSGFSYHARVSISTSTTTAGEIRWFVGLTSSANALPNANPTAFSGTMIGVCADSSDTNIKAVIGNSSTGYTTQTAGVDFPKRRTSGSTAVVYDISITYKSITGCEIEMRRLDMGAAGTANVNDWGYPRVFTFNDTTSLGSVWLTPQIWINNGTQTVDAQMNVSFQTISDDMWL